MDRLAHLGLGEMSLRIGTNVLALLLILAVVWLMHTVYRGASLGGSQTVLAASAPTSTPGVSLAALAQAASPALNGIPRLTQFHTIIPSRPRQDVTQYTVQIGDSMFSIASKFNLDPKTILWGNYEVLKDDVELLKPGQKLNILPVDGTYYQWMGTESLTAVAKYFGVDPQVIIDSPANHLDLATIGDLSHPNIPVNTLLVVPGGSRPFTSWQAPIGITRSTPASTNVWGPGACGAVSGGAVGFGTFVWPTPQHWISGTDFHPELGHPAIDIAAGLDTAIWAVDAGVVVYAGWNTWGYGNLTIIDHGNGWQSLYAHQDKILVQCGQSVGQGQLIGLAGMTGHATGPHLHFELWNLKFGKVNPHLYLPPP